MYTVHTTLDIIFSCRQNEHQTYQKADPIRLLFKHLEMATVPFHSIPFRSVTNEMHLNYLHIQFDTVISGVFYPCNFIKYHCRGYSICPEIWRKRKGHLADGRGMINELQENIATAKLQPLYISTKRNTHNT